MGNQNQPQNIRALYQLGIMRLEGNRFRFSFIYEMDNGRYSQLQEELPWDKAVKYFEAQDWDPIWLPPKDGQTINMVSRGKLADAFAQERKEMKR